MSQLERLYHLERQIAINRHLTVDGHATVDESIEIPVEYKFLRYNVDPETEAKLAAIVDPVERQVATDLWLATQTPFSVTRDGHALLGDALVTNVGSGYLWQRAFNGTLGTAFNAANAYTGVGDNTGAAAASQTDLQASANKTRKGMDTNWPQWGNSTNNTATSGLAGGPITDSSITNKAQSMQFRSTYGTTDALYAWQEFGIFNGSSAGAGDASAAGIMLDRFVTSQGTKASGQIWVLVVTLTIS